MPSGTEADSPDPEMAPTAILGVDPPDSPTSISCAACRRPIVDHFFEINRTIVCEPCRDSIVEQLRGGSRVGRFVRAAVLGVGAAIVGTALYSAFLTYASFDLSLVAILIGYMVGRLVHKGSGGIGGTTYQLLAVVLTYASLGMTYFTVTIVDLVRGNVVAGPIIVTPEVVLAMLNYAFQMPVLRMKSAPIQIFFVGFALWEAWKLNRPRQLVLTGPHRVVD